MTKLPIIAQGSGKQVSWIGLENGAAVFADELAEQLFGTYRSLLDASDEETYDALATGWSNGYLTIPAR